MGRIETQTGKRTQNFSSCKECAAYFGIIDLPDWMVKTELCLVHLNKDWCKEIIEAIDLLKRAKITSATYKRSHPPLPLENLSEEIYSAFRTLKDEDITGVQYHGTKVSCKLERKN